MPRATNAKRIAELERRVALLEAVLAELLDDQSEQQEPTPPGAHLGSEVPEQGIPATL